jgi:hypothetical protein
MSRTTFGLLLSVTAAMAATTASAQQGRELPFSQQYRRPAISPYNQLNTFGSNPLLMQNVYQQQIQPQVQQQQQQIEQLQQRRQMSKLQNQVQQIGRDTSARQLNESIRSTGHRATYQNYSHYYQQGR